MKKNLLQSIILFVVSAILILSGIFFLPSVTNYGNDAVLFVIGIILLCYVYGYLLIRVAKKTKGTIFIFTLIEMILLTALALTCMLTKVFGKPIISEGFVIAGVALWIRGVVESFRNHFYSIENKQNSLYKVILNILFITIGTYFIMNPILTNLELLYGLCVSFFTLSVVLIILGILKLTK